MDRIYVREGDGLFLGAIKLVYLPLYLRCRFMPQCGDGTRSQRCIGIRP